MCKVMRHCDIEDLTAYIYRMKMFCMANATPNIAFWFRPVSTAQRMTMFGYVLEKLG